MINKKQALFMPALLALAVAGCSSSDSSSSSSTGTLSLDITDAPVDSLTKVVVTFNEITLHPSEGDDVVITLEAPESINLLDFQEGKTSPLLEDHVVPAGEYTWMRLGLSEDPSELYIEEDTGGVEPMTIPSGGNTGLKLNRGFTVLAGGSTNFTIDFDARKSVTLTGGGEYKLRPTLRITDNSEAGSIIGTVSGSTLDTNCTDKLEYQGLVYVYEEHDVTPTDLYQDRTAGETDPLVAVPVTLDEESGEYTYKASFIAAGNYTVAYSCGDDPADTEETLSFIDAQNVVVIADEDTEADFPVPTVL